MPPLAPAACSAAVASPGFVDAVSYQPAAGFEAGESQRDQRRQLASRAADENRVGVGPEVKLLGERQPASASV